MNMLNNVMDMIMSIVNKIFGWIDSIMNAFIQGENKYIIYAVFIYLIGVFSIGKVRLNVTTKK